MMTRNKKSFIGITGTNASGKGEVTQYLQSKGYQYISLSDILRVIVKDKGLPTDRINLTTIGQEERTKHGPGFLAQRALVMMDTNIDYVIDSIRHPEEVRILSENLPSFELWAVDADPEIRFQRSQQRGRNENASTLEEFLAQENQEKTDNPNAQQLHTTFELADHTLSNNASLEDLINQISPLLDQ